MTDVLESDHIQFRCGNCHAEGAMNDMTMTLEEKNCKLVEEDNRRDLFYMYCCEPHAKARSGR